VTKLVADEKVNRQGYRHHANNKPMWKKIIVFGFQVNVVRTDMFSANYSALTSINDKNEIIGYQSKFKPYQGRV
jgi:hypothetical protein